VLERSPHLLTDDGAALAGNVVALSARRRWPLWLGSGIAASLAALMIAGQALPPQPQVFDTASQSRTIALEDGSSVVMAPRSRLTVGGRDGTQLALEGAAYFDIRHRPDRALEVQAGGVTVTDIGTRFDIRTHDGRVQIEVAEGEVSATADALRNAERLTAGKRLVLDPGQGRALVSSVSRDDVGTWRSGRLSYDAEPLDLVAADLARYAGVRVEVSHALGGQRFSGSLFIGDGESAIRDLAQLMQLGLRHDGAVWRLEPAG